VVNVLADRRFDLVRRAIEEGVLDPDIEMGGESGASGAKLIHAVAAFPVMRLLRYLILERGVDPNEREGDDPNEREGEKGMALAELDQGEEEKEMAVVGGWLGEWVGGRVGG
jgi:hypothetical protein